MNTSAPSSSGSAVSSSTFDEYAQKLQELALKTTRHAASMPADINFHRSMDMEFSSDIDAFSARLLSLTNKLLSFSNTIDATSASRDKGKAKLQTQDDVTDDFHSVVVDCMDQLLERTDICLDEYLGRKKPPAIAINPTPAKATKVITKTKIPGTTRHLDPALQHASRIPKPQLSFKYKIDNSDAPWYPSLTHKYNARVPLGYDYRDSHDQESESSIQAHPYRYEITHFTPPVRMFVMQTPTPPPPLSDTSFTWVSTKEEFTAMLAKLRQSSEIAVDLEHNSYRSYAGLVCLMQLSSRQEDWIVDALTLREELVELNEVFTDPEIVKVFHGADSDIIWLQQNFNLYIVNLFDTFHASKLLDFPRHGLANLLEMYCDFIPDKRYQLADWRIRPLPNEMLLYAHADTHFLLYIYDCLRNALIDRSQSRSGLHSPSTSTAATPMPDGPHSLLHAVIARSRETSLRTYQKELYDAFSGSGPNGWDTLARKWNKPLLYANNNGGIGEVQRSIYRAVHAWRDKVAREEDESTRYILSNHYLFQLAEHPPKDLGALLSMFLSGSPHVVRRRAKELLDATREVLKAIPSSTTAVDTSEDYQAEATLPSQEIAAVVSGKLSSATQERDIWTAKKNAVTMFTTKESSLFKSMSPTPTVSVIAATKCTLFGQRRIENGPPSQSHFKDLVSRINSTLAIAPVAPKIALPKEARVIKPHSELETENDMTNTLGMQVEVPFVPAAERKSKVLDEYEKDTIVVVGKKRTKKRKRAIGRANSEQGAGQSSSTLANGGGDVNMETQPQKEGEEMTSGDISPGQKAFDFSAVPNILDDASDNGAGGAVRQKRHKSDKARGSNVLCGRPTRAHRDFRGGNRSHTFKG